MIPKMNKRVAGLVALLGLAFVASSRPALAQEAGNSWFDDGSAPSPADAPPPPPDQPGPADAPSNAPGAPGPRPLVPYNATPGAPSPQSPPQQEDNVPETDPRAITEFRSTLDPYGAWVNDEKYGTVWVPNRDAVGPDFAPYVSAGHWALTDDGDWIWQSDYPFGGVVFHYGRWVWVPGTGWAWVAGRRYANAWVTWRVSTDDYGYIGWAPMPPAWGWYGGSAISLWWYPPTAYVFCPNRYAFSYRVHSYIVHDRYVIHDVAAHTRNYYDGRAQHVAAQPRVLPANSAAPRGPTLQSARIPASAAPSSRVPMRSAFGGPRSDGQPATRQAGFDRRSSSSGARPTQPSSYPAPYRSPSYNSNSYARPSYTAPLTNGYRTPTPARSYTAPAPATRYSAPSSPAYRSAPSFSSPSYRSAPSHYSAPSYRSAPSFSSPSYRSAPSFHSAPSAPSRSFHSPSRR